MGILGSLYVHVMSEKNISEFYLLKTNKTKKNKKKNVSTLKVNVLILSGQNEVCMFYHLDASCRYRIDGVSLSAIKVSVDQCSDPIKVKFDITVSSVCFNTCRFMSVT